MVDVQKLADTPVFSSAIDGLSFSPDGALLAVAASTNDGLRVYLVNGWDRVAAVPSINTPGTCAFSPDGTYLAVSLNESPHVRLFEVGSWSEVSLPAMPSDVYFMDWSSDSHYLAMGHYDGNGRGLDVLDVSSMELVAAVPSLPSWVGGVAFSPSGVLAATYDPGFQASNGPGVLLLDSSDWSEITFSHSLPGYVNVPGFNLDGAYLAVAHRETPGVTIFETSGWSVVAEATSLSSHGWAAQFALNADLLFVAANAENLVTLDVPGFGLASLDGEIAPTHNPRTMAVSSTGLLALGMTGGERLEVYEVGRDDSPDGDWSEFAPRERQSIYLLEIGSLQLPITSAQATMRLAGQSFLQAVVPDGETYIDALTPLLQEPMTLRAGYRYADGTLSPLEDIAAAPFQELRRSQGAQRDTLTLSGYGAREPGSGVRFLREIQTRTTETDGRRRVRCSLDLRLRPGSVAQDADGTTFTVGIIQYFINAVSEGMEVIQDG